ncbi:hypothetical protein NMG60_11034328 [Bertholletia excelsa]
MNLKAPLAFRCKKLIIIPCRKFLHFLKFRLKKKPLFIRALRFRGPVRRIGLLSPFSCLRRSREMDRLMALKSFSDAGQQHKVPFPSPLTPAYVRISAAQRKDAAVQGDVEEACRSFEAYLVEMIVEEGKVRDLTDVEELLYCWKKLRCPVFIDLVCRFYGELCKDLFCKREESSITSS